jgi:hypothetical protein
MANAMCDSFKEEILRGGVHSFGTTEAPGTGFKMALYAAGSTLDGSVTNVATMSTELADGNGYTTGGADLDCFGATRTGSVAWIDFDDVSWVGATFTAVGCLLYNGAGGNAISVHDFGSFTVSNGTFTVLMPAPNNGATAILQIA